MSKPRKKKRVSQDTTPKKRRTKEQIRRSKAAKKGWQTRRTNILADLKTAIPLAKRDKRTKLQLLAALELEKLTKGWVPSSEDHMLHGDGSIARYPSHLRHPRLGAKMLPRLRKAENEGPKALRDLVRAYAAEFDYPVQEIYTLLMSP